MPKSDEKTTDIEHILRRLENHVIVNQLLVMFINEKGLSEEVDAYLDYKLNSVNQNVN